MSLARFELGTGGYNVDFFNPLTALLKLLKFFPYLYLFHFKFSLSRKTFL